MVFRASYLGYVLNGTLSKQKGTPTQTLTYYSPSYGDPQKGKLVLGVRIQVFGLLGWLFGFTGRGLGVKVY